MNGDQGTQMPGQQYTPNDGSSVSAEMPQKPAAAPPQQAAPSPVQAPLPQQPTVVARAATSRSQPSGGFYHADSPDDVSGVSAASPGESVDAIVPSPKSEISWTAGGDAVSAHATAWRLRMIGLSLLLGIIILIVTSGDWFPAGSIVVAGVLFGLLGSRRSPRLAYQVDARGVMIGQKHYAYGDFRAFSVFGDRATSIIELIPLQRFMPAILLHLDQAQGQQVVDTLSSYLPMQPHRQDVVDHIVNSVRI